MGSVHLVNNWRRPDRSIGIGLSVHTARWCACAVEVERVDDMAVSAFESESPSFDPLLLPSCPPEEPPS